MFKIPIIIFNAEMQRIRKERRGIDENRVWFVIDYKRWRLPNK
jgi:hypothetical protein